MAKGLSTAIQITLSTGQLCLRRAAFDILRFRAHRSMAPISAAELYQDLLLFSFRIAGAISLRRKHDECHIFLFDQFDRVSQLTLGRDATSWRDLVEIANGIGTRGPTVTRLWGETSLLSSLPPSLNRLEQTDNDDLTAWLRRLSEHTNEERGRIYERFLSLELGWKKGKLGLRPAAGGSRKQRGVYYTPERLVEFAIEKSEQAMESMSSSFSVPRICDPACGSGQFLLHCAGVLLRRLEHQGECLDATSTVIGHSLYGIDLDPIAVENSRFALLERCTHPDEIWHLVWAHIRQGDTLNDIADLCGNSMTVSVEPRIQWRRDFSDVFRDDGEDGFDLIVGNPPWDKIEVLTRERGDHLIDLDGEYPNLASQEYWQNYVDGLRKFIRRSGFFPLSGHGRINTYCAFLECSLKLLSPHGLCTMIVPTGMVTDHSTSRFVNSIIENNQLYSVYDFDNRSGFFKEVQGNVQFCVLTMGRKNRGNDQFIVASRLRDTTVEKVEYCLTAADVRRFNPESGTIPIFSNQTSLRIASVIYRHALTVAESPWFVSLKQGHFNMTTGKRYFIKSLVDGAPGRSLYEAKLCHQYEHRSGTFEGMDASRAYGVHPKVNRPTQTQLGDPAYEICPRYRVPDTVWRRRGDAREWYLVYRNTVSTVADSRSCVASILPAGPIGNSLSFFNTVCTAKQEALILACLNSLVVDYTLREKTSGSNLNFYVMRQLPVLNFTSEEQNNPFVRHPELLRWLCDSVVRLTFSSYALTPFARACEYPGEPVHLKPTERLALKAEIDGLLCVLFGLKGHDVDFILSTFSTLHRVETRKFGAPLTSQHVRSSYEHFSRLMAVSG